MVGLKKYRVVAGAPIEEDEKIFETVSYDLDTKILFLRHLTLGSITCWVNPTQIIGKTDIDSHVNFMKQNNTIIC